MGLSPTADPTSAQHYRRSSQLAASHLPTPSTETGPGEGRSESSGGTASGADQGYQQPTKDERSDGSLIESESTEMDHVNSDDNMNDDEETALTTHERRKILHMRRRQRRDLDSRIVDTRITNSGRRMADQTVVKKLAMNTVFILLWYIFSLAISIVSYAPSSAL